MMTLALEISGGWLLFNCCVGIFLIAPVMWHELRAAKIRRRWRKSHPTTSVEWMPRIIVRNRFQ